MDDSEEHTPKKWLPSKVYAEQFNACWYQVYDRTLVKQEALVCYGSRQINFESKLCSEFPDSGIIELKKGRIIGDGWVFSQDNYLLPQHSWYGLNIDEVRIPRFLHKANYLKGVYLSLASNWSGKNYAHFLLDSVSRLHLFEEAKLSLNDVDHIYCPTPNTPNALKILEKLGIPLSKCILTPYSQNSGIQAEVVLAASFPGLRRNYPEWVTNFLSRIVKKPLNNPSRRLYITRGNNSRKIINEQNLLSILHKYGFENYDPSKQTNQPMDFANASIVVGAHGAGLANLAFCQSGISVLELMPSDHVFPYYFSLSQAAKLKYGFLVGISIKERDLQLAYGPSPYDFYVDEDEFHDALTKVINLSKT